MDPRKTLKMDISASGKYRKSKVEPTSSAFLGIINYLKLCLDLKKKMEVVWMEINGLSIINRSFLTPVGKIQVEKTIPILPLEY